MTAIQSDHPCARCGSDLSIWPRNRMLTYCPSCAVEMRREHHIKAGRAKRAAGRRQPTPPPGESAA